MPEQLLCRLDQLPNPGEAREFEIEGRTICVARLKAEIFAMDNVCPHRGGPLGQGMIEHGKLICPWHGWAFDPRTGAVSHNPNFRATVFPLRIDGEQVWITL
ncbi:MAG: hypothetical protein NVS9B15_07570 [Acidobacteriaceae bacterium]